MGCPSCWFVDAYPRYPPEFPPKKTQISPWKWLKPLKWSQRSSSSMAKLQLSESKESEEFLLGHVHLTDEPSGCKWLQEPLGFFGGSDELNQLRTGEIKIVWWIDDLWWIDECTSENEQTVDHRCGKSTVCRSFSWGNYGFLHLREFSPG